jgi:mannosyltransferase
MNNDLRKIIDFVADEKRSKPILLSIALLAMFLQLYNLGRKSLWFDEAASFGFSSLNLRDILASPDYFHPPLYSVILHFFLYLGKSEYLVRLPSVIFSILCILLIYRLGKEFFDFRVGLVSAFLLAISPMLYYYAQEARMYTLLIFLSLLSLDFFLNAIRKNEAWLWIGFVASTSLNIYTHYYAFLVIFIELIFIVIFIKKYSLIFSKFVMCIMTILLLFVPQFFKLYSAFQSMIDWGPDWGLHPTLLFVPQIFYKLSIGTGFSVEKVEFFNRIFSGDLLGTNPILGSILLFIVFLYGLYASRREYREETCLSMIWIFIPVIIAYVIAFKSIVHENYIIFILPIYLIVVSKGLIDIKKKNFIASLVLIFIIILSNAYFLHVNYIAPKEDWRSVALYIKDNSSPGDIILVDPSYTACCFTFYGLEPKMIIEQNKEFEFNRSLFLRKIAEISSRPNPRLWIPYVPSRSSDSDKHLLNWLNLNCVKRYESSFALIYLCERNSSQIPFY